MPHCPAARPALSHHRGIGRWRVCARLLALMALMAPATPLLTGCASAPAAAAADSLLRDHLYRAPAAALPSADQLLSMSPAMRDFVAGEGQALSPLRDPRRALIDALYRSQAPERAGLRLEYDSTRTRTAAEAFEARAGNCLSLVMMTAAFARHLELSVSYQSVRVEEFYTRAGTLTMASGHVNLVLGPRLARGMLDRSDPELMVVDFLLPRDTRQQRSLLLQEPTIVAMYFNNRAAELMAAGHLDDAYWHAREAIRHDPAFVTAVNTLGVVHQRAGHPDAAEAAFRHVLARDARAVAALGNLVALLQSRGRDAESAVLARRLAELQPEPPFHWLRLGRDALAAGDAARAVELLQRELRRQPEQDEVHFALAEALLRQGDVTRAQHHLARAAAFSTRQTDQRRYESKLTQLRAAQQAPGPP